MSIVDSIDHFGGRTERFQQVRETVEAVFTEGADILRSVHQSHQLIPGKEHGRTPPT